MHLDGPLCILLPLLPISSNGPIISLGGTVDLFGWAHCILLLLLPILLSPQRDLMYNVGGAVNTLTQMGTACALVLLVNVTRPSLQ